MAISDAELTLGEVNQAIRAILLTGQSYTRAGFSLNRANLPELRALRKELKFENARKSSTGSTAISDFSGADGTSTESDDWGD